MNLKQKKVIAREGLLFLGSLILASVLLVSRYNYTLRYSPAWGGPIFLYTIFILALFIYSCARFTLWAIQTLKEKE